MTALYLDYASVFVFALTGSLVASRKCLDIFGFVFVANLTALGGGTVRDLLLDRRVFWLDHAENLWIATLAAAVTFFLAHRLHSRIRTVVLLDAVALAIAVAAGVVIAAGVDSRPEVVMLMGVATGCFGGMLRDVVCNELPLILKEGELYATAAFGGALAFVAVEAAGAPRVAAVAAAVLVTLGLRTLSVYAGLRLPVFRRPPGAPPP